MPEFFENIMPNVIKKLPELGKATVETLEMTGISTLFIMAIGMALGILLTVTKKGGLAENTAVYRVLDVIINLLRSIPFIILLFHRRCRVDIPTHSRDCPFLLKTGGSGAGRCESGAYRSSSVDGLFQVRDNIPGVPPREYPGAFPWYHDNPHQPGRTHRHGWCGRRRRTRQLRLRPGRAEK